MGPRLDNRGWALVEQGHDDRLCLLQWVHGWITVVGHGGQFTMGAAGNASMGPRLDNRGWARTAGTALAQVLTASMGPRLDNRGWARECYGALDLSSKLQWVHGWITVVGPCRRSL